MFPKNYYYTKDHEWLSVNDGEARVGITAHAAEQLGDIVFVELPEPGKHFGSGDEFATIESVKAVAEVFMPVAGEVLETNEALEDNPESVNQHPHDDGWLVLIKLDDSGELKELMDVNAYEQFVKEESK